MKPSDAQYRNYYYEYTVVVEEYRSSGYPEVTMTFYPRLVCNSYAGCPGAYTPPASALEVRYRYEDACYAGTYEAFDLYGYRDPISSAVLHDNLGSNCGYQDALTLDVTYADGTREYLVGYRTY